MYNDDLDIDAYLKKGESSKVSNVRYTLDYFYDMRNKPDAMTLLLTYKQIDLFDHDRYIIFTCETIIDKYQILYCLPFDETKPHYLIAYFNDVSDITVDDMYNLFNTIVVNRNDIEQYCLLYHLFNQDVSLYLRELSRIKYFRQNEDIYCNDFIFCFDLYHNGVYYDRFEEHRDTINTDLRDAIEYVSSMDDIKYDNVAKQFNDIFKVRQLSKKDLMTQRVDKFKYLTPQINQIENELMMGDVDDSNV